MKKDNVIFLEHILEPISDIEDSVGGIFKVEFKKNKDIRDATIRRLEIIGEAVKNLSSGFRTKHEEVSWSKIAGMRDKLMHHYFGVNLNIVWDVVKGDLPVLKKQIEGILEGEK